MSHLEVAPLLHILCQSFPPLHQLLQCQIWPLWFIVYIWIIVCYDFSSWGVSLSLLLRDTRIGLRHFYTPLWLWWWMFHHLPIHLGLVQATVSTTDVSCYHHYNDYSSGREHQCQLTIIKSSPQLTELGSLLHLFNTATLPPSQAYKQHCLMIDHWSVLLPSMLCGLWNTAFLFCLWVW